ncbi:MAG TPA: septal ring lytic transglycosylase RlpA family protein [Methylovirgula sp.]
MCFVGAASAVPFGPGSADSETSVGASASWSEQDSFHHSFTNSHTDYHESYGGSVIKASYYSSGSRTASGERFNPNGYTAASRTLPFGTMLRLTNPRTGRSVVVRVNDRGPFVRGRSLDVARGAAAALGMIAQGTASLVMARVN